MKRFLNAPYRFALCWTALLMTVFCWALLDTFVIAHRERITVELRQTISALTGTPMPDSTNDVLATPTPDGVDGGVSASATNAASIDETASAANVTNGASGDAAASATNAASIDETASTANSESNSANPSTTSAAAAPLITATSYQDEAIQIDIQTFRAFSTTCYAATVTLSDLSHLRTALAENTYGRNIRQPVREIAQAHQAILAINGDYYGSRNSGYVVRNGEVYRDRAPSGGGDALLIDLQGNLSTTDETLSSAQLDDLWQAFSFGPTLVNSFQVCVNEGDEVSQAMLSNPRTAIGQIAPLQYVLFVSDGRTDESEGLSLYQLAEVMRELGCQTAYNLDGGGSSTMVFMGELVNNPTTNGRRISERSVSDIVYIGD